MAIGGGVTTAFRCSAKDGKMATEQTSMLKSECASVDKALEVLAQNGSCVVASADIPTLRRRLHEIGMG